MLNATKGYVTFLVLVWWVGKAFYTSLHVALCAVGHGGAYTHGAWHYIVRGIYIYI